MALDVNTLISKSLSKYSEESATETETETSNDLAVNLESVNEETSTGSLAIDLESVAAEKEFSDLISEDVMNNLKGAIGAGIATVAVLEARAAKREAA